MLEKDEQDILFDYLIAADTLDEFLGVDEDNQDECEVEEEN